ncbi:MAG TPA: 50S ribosomal protein L5 [Candidatus Acidoferrales bacterium]|nr:50S ribosomal protein L5 [Candidatus Acidoferrales bacterium]
MAKEKTNDPAHRKENPPKESAAADPKTEAVEKKKKPAQAKPATEKSKAKPEKAKAEEPPEPKVPPRLFEIYRKDIIPALMKRFSYKNTMQVPKLEKIALNCGVGAATQDPKILDTVVRELTVIAGQKPSIRKSKKAISNFKLRENIPIGCKVTLRREKMYEFMDRLITLAIPRVRDFRGVPDKSFDGRGNYTLGLKEQIIFPEIDVDKVERIFGMDITFVTTAKTDEEAYELLKGFGMPFRKREASEGEFGKAA